MYSKEETRLVKHEFWNSFSVMMRKYSSKYGTVNWSNYKTKIKDLYFRLDFTENYATFSIELQHPESIRGLFYEQFIELKVLLEKSLEEKLIWEEEHVNVYKNTISRIYICLPHVSIYNKEDWQKTQNFLEKKITQMHIFWLDYRELFKNLES
ncbi:MAG: DUF4268 domain-containing protein [Flavobacteriales bacterium]|nr:DUF4268 domain-containing protein [Flavobacteriales bacterium]